VDDAIGCASAGPDEEQDVFACGGGVDFGDELIGAGYGVTIDFEDDVARGQACVFSRAGGLYALNGCAVDFSGEVELLANVGGDIADGDAEFCAFLA
jgi:hypothetical protein